MSPTPTKSSQINTRSATVNKKALSPVTMDDLHRSIAEIRNSQTDMLGQCKAMNLSQNSKLAELLSCIDFFKSQLAEIRSENTTLRNEIASLNNRVQVLENSTDGSSNMSQLIQELANREICARNIIVHGLQESSSNDPTARIASDIKLLDDNIHPCNLTLPQDLKLFRLGRKISGKPRPLKVVLQSKEMALSLVSVFNSHKRTQSVPANSISISRDRTLLERQEIRRVYTELENRKKNGEHNISIKYRNGIPLIVPNDGGVTGSHSNHPSSSLSKN
jgi:hypothetical protein